MDNHRPAHPWLICVDLLDDALALDDFQAALGIARALGSAQWTERLVVWELRCRVRLGQMSSDEARSALALYVPPADPPGSIGQRRACATLANIEMDAGRPERALELTHRLLGGAAGPRSAEAMLLRANALAALGRSADADAACLEARRIAQAHGPHAVLWRIAAARARLWSAADSALAATEARLARTELHALAASIPDDALRAGFLAAQEARPWLPAQRARATPDAPNQLTRREHEIAAYVARGLTNKEIAADLSLAEKTIEMHVSNCLSKLGFRSRTQLAAWAAVRG